MTDSKPKEKKIRVAEHFSSIQGEGSTMGLPSIFLRLQGCNLLCGNPKIGIKGATQKQIEQNQGDNAGWTCDTISVWSQGEKRLVSDVVEDFKALYAKEFITGSQLVITGGEPLMQADALPTLIESLRRELAKDIRVEIETNGTISPTFELTSMMSPSQINQFNVSPKLRNSGMPEDRRIKGKAMRRLVMAAEKGQAIFKFVITGEGDLTEMEETYINRFSIPRNKVYLMPGCTTKEQFDEVAPKVAETCRRTGYHFSSRLQINLWDQTTGV